jgi:hypothetical protein
VIGRHFVVKPDLFLMNAANRSFVEGRTDRPQFPVLWLAALLDLPISIGLLGLGAGVLPIPLSDDIAAWRPLLLVLGLVSLGGSVFIVTLIRRLGQGVLLEGRVVEADLRPARKASQRHLKVQHITMQFRTPDGQTLAAVIRRPDQARTPLPPVGAQAAVMYVSPQQFRLL